MAIFIIFVKNGLGVKQDKEEAEKYFKKSVDSLLEVKRQGISAAQVMLGLMYLSGIGVEQDKRKAKDLLCQSADFILEAAKWSPDYQLVLGLMYIEGIGFEEDFQEGIKWWQKAAEQGNNDAQEILYKIGIKK